MRRGVRGKPTRRDPRNTRDGDERHAGGACTTDVFLKATGDGLGHAGQAFCNFGRDLGGGLLPQPSVDAAYRPVGVGSPRRREGRGKSVRSRPSARGAPGRVKPSCMELALQEQGSALDPLKMKPRGSSQSNKRFPNATVWRNRDAKQIDGQSPGLWLDGSSPTRAGVECRWTVLLAPARCSHARAMISLAGSSTRKRMLESAVVRHRFGSSKPNMRCPTPRPVLRPS